MLVCEFSQGDVRQSDVFGVEEQHLFTAFTASVTWLFYGVTSRITHLRVPTHTRNSNGKGARITAIPNFLLCQISHLYVTFYTKFHMYYLPAIPNFTFISYLLYQLSHLYITCYTTFHMHKLPAMPDFKIKGMKYPCCHKRTYE